MTPSRSRVRHRQDQSRNASRHLHLGAAMSEHGGLGEGQNNRYRRDVLEANAALRSIVRRDSRESYEEFLTKLAKASGIGTPKRAYGLTAGAASLSPAGVEPPENSSRPSGSVTVLAFAP